MNPSPHLAQKRHGVQAKRLNLHKTMQKHKLHELLPFSRAAEAIASDAGSVAASNWSNRTSTTPARMHRQARWCP